MAECILPCDHIQPKRLFYAYETAHINKLRESDLRFRGVPVLPGGGRTERCRAVRPAGRGSSAPCRTGGGASSSSVARRWSSDDHLAIIGAGVAGRMLAADQKAAEHVGLAESPQVRVRDPRASRELPASSVSPPQPTDPDPMGEEA